MKNRKCPICKKKIPMNDAGSLSRKDGKTIICSSCGKRQALTQYHIAES